jgi:hypothetical protein
MDPTHESRRGYLSIDAFDPATKETCGILISHDRMLTVARRSMAHAKECAYIVPQILQRPAAVFEGLRHDDDEDRRGTGWRCYCGSPDRAYRADGTERSPYPGQVYLVFVNDEAVAYNWRWEQADPRDANLPKDFDQRFRSRLL